MDDKQRIAMLDSPLTPRGGIIGAITRLFRRNTNTPSGGKGAIYILANHLGSSCLELDENAQTISYEEYHPYGTTAYQAKNANIQAAAKRYRYTGMERDEETGLAYHTARYYIPWLGRWCSADPIGIGDGVNVYCYCKGNVQNLRDPNGKEVIGKEIRDAANSEVPQNPFVEALIMIYGVEHESKKLDSSLLKKEMESNEKLRVFFSLGLTTSLEVYRKLDKEKTGTLANAAAIIPEYLFKNLQNPERFEKSKIDSGIYDEGSIKNAFRHALLSTLLTVELGLKTSFIIASSHEEDPFLLYRGNQTYGLSNKNADAHVDLLNNRIGRQIGEKLTSNRRDIALAVLEYFHKNGLYILEKQKDEKGNEALVPTLYRLTDDEFTLLKDKLMKLDKKIGRAHV